MTLTNTLREKANAGAAAAAEARKKAAAEYFDLLARDSAPGPGDEKALAACMRTLGRSVDDLPGDLAAVEAIVEAETLAPELPARQAAWEQANVAWNDAIAERARTDEALQRKIEQRDAALAAAHSNFNEAESASRALPRLRAQWAKTLAVEGDAPQQAEAPPIRPGGKLRSRLEILEQAHRDFVVAGLHVSKGDSAQSYVNRLLADKREEPITAAEFANYLAGFHETFKAAGESAPPDGPAVKYGTE